MTKWISVKDRLPTEGAVIILREYHGKNHNKVVVIGCLNENTNLDYTHFMGGSALSKPIYWQQLPLIDV